MKKIYINTNRDFLSIQCVAFNISPMFLVILFSLCLVIYFRYDFLFYKTHNNIIHYSGCWQNQWDVGVFDQVYELNRILLRIKRNLICDEPLVCTLHFLICCSEEIVYISMHHSWWVLSVNIIMSNMFETFTMSFL